MQSCQHLPDDGTSIKLDGRAEAPKGGGLQREAEMEPVPLHQVLHTEGTLVYIHEVTYSRTCPRAGEAVAGGSTRMMHSGCVGQIRAKPLERSGQRWGKGHLPLPLRITVAWVRQQDPGRWLRQSAATASQLRLYWATFLCLLELQPEEDCTSVFSEWSTRTGRVD